MSLRSIVFDRKVPEKGEAQTPRERMFAGLDIPIECANCQFYGDSSKDNNWACLTRAERAGKLEEINCPKK